MRPGQRWITRSGAIVEIVERRDTGLVMHDLAWKPAGKAYMLICKFVRYIDGVEPLTDEPPRQFGLHDDGRYCGRGHALDLVRQSGGGGSMTEATCVRRSKAGITCCEPAVIHIDGQTLCALHAQEAQAKKKKGRKRGR